LDNILQKNIGEVLYTNIELKLPNKSHGQMHHKIGVTRVFNGYEILYSAVIT